MNTSRPSGTVTFLFTDIQGSTSIAQQHPEAWLQLRERHDAILAAGIQARDGFVFQIVGDQFCGAFHTAADAVMAAVEVQRTLGDEPWSPAKIKVRMGLYSGTAQPGAMEDRSGGYTGYTALASTQRVMSTAHGGQILLSNTTADLARADLPDEIHLIDMGEHRLKGLSRPQHLWQVYTEGLEHEFSALKTLDSVPNNLPVQLTEFVGREQAISELLAELDSHRLVTLTGPGGTGKTRLALRVGAEVIDAFPDGVWFVELAPLSDGDLVPQAVASALGVREQAGFSMSEVLAEHVADLRLLLILDNCEHLLDASASLAADLLRSAQAIKLIATSRESLHIGGEHVYVVPPLSFPDPAKVNSVADLAGFEAMQLFLDRASDAQPAFRIDDQKATALARICQQLDGIPFAIELAAARTRSLSIDAIAERLNDRFRLLARGDRTAVPRQQTLRALLDWSYELLTESERRLLGRLSVFRSGWTLEAAEAVTTGEAVETADVIDLLSSLVDKSLVTLGADGSRYNMLETVRQYGAEKLQTFGEDKRFRERHAVHLARLAEEAAPRLTQADQPLWLARLEVEHDNLRAALEWALSGDRDLNLALRLVSAVTPFWVLRGHFAEGFAHATAVLARAGDDTEPELRMTATIGAARLAYRQNSLDEAGRFYADGLDLARELDDPIRTAQALEGLGNVATEMGDYESAPDRFLEALNLYRRTESRTGIADADMNLAWASMRTGDAHTAEELLTEALHLYEEVGNQPGIGFSLSGLGEAYLRQSKLEPAIQMLERSLVVRESLGDKWGMAATLGSMAWASLNKGDAEKAEQYLKRSLRLRQEIGDKGGMAWCLEKLAEMSADSGEPGGAARLYGAAHALRESIGSVIDPADQPAHEARIAKLKKTLGENAFEDQWNEGTAIPRQAILQEILADAPL